jgi:CO/xanthine dehydrogenase Mo-binding subunit
MHPSGASVAAPRGFIIDRGDGRASLPGSLHTNRRLAQWLSFDQPGRVTAFTGKAELGQGILTALRVLVADELDVALDAVSIEPASTHRGPDEAVTSGSLSIQDSGTALRHACAELRSMALARVAGRAGIPAAQLRVEAGHFLGTDGRSVGNYWSELSAADLDCDYQGLSQPKPAAARRLIGRADIARIDLPDKAFGRPRFIHDLRLPGMLHARVLRPPTLSAQLEGPDEGAMQRLLPEGVRLLVDGRFIAVLGAVERAVERAADRLAAALRWRSSSALPDPTDLAGFLRSAPCQTTIPAQRAAVAAAGAVVPGATAGGSDSARAAEASAPSSWPSDGRRFVADYLKPYLAHASIGPSCALARWADGRLEVWTHSQGIHNLRDDLVIALAADPAPPSREAILIHHVEGAGCYGHNGADDVAFDAVLLARANPGAAVRVLWSRADELTHSPLGAAQSVRLEARVDDQGRITHWQHEVWANGYSSRPGRAKTPTLLAASQRARATELPLAVNPPLATGGGADRNAVPGYQLPHFRVLNHRLLVMPLRTSAMRALGGYANVFAIESFIDEIAESIGDDRIAFRRRHLDDPRALAVIDEVLAQSRWQERRGALGEGQGIGFGWARYKNSGAWCAVVAEVEVSDRVRVLRLELAADVGMVVDRDGVINQIEGGAIQSTSWTLKEQVRFDQNGLRSTGWESYPILRFSELPEVRVHLLDRPDQAPLGAGEAAQGPVAAAIANAVSHALGVRVRALPLDPEQLLRAVHAADVA